MTGCGIRKYFLLFLSPSSYLQGYSIFLVSCGGMTIRENNCFIVAAQRLWSSQSCCVWFFVSQDQMPANRLATQNRLPSSVSWPQSKQTSCITNNLCNRQSQHCKYAGNNARGNLVPRKYSTTTQSDVLDFHGNVMDKVKRTLSLPILRTVHCVVARPRLT